MNKSTVILGASPSADRYSYRATLSLKQHGHTVYPVGLRAGKIGDIDIIIDKPAIQNVDTITLYVGPDHQAAWTDYILSLKPKRLVFNPGAENSVLFEKATAAGIECIEACTLVMLSIGNY